MEWEDDNTITKEETTITGKDIVFGSLATAGAVLCFFGVIAAVSSSIEYGLWMILVGIVSLAVGLFFLKILKIGGKVE